MQWNISRNLEWKHFFWVGKKGFDVGIDPCSGQHRPQKTTKWQNVTRYQDHANNERLFWTQRTSIAIVTSQTWFYSEFSDLHSLRTHLCVCVLFLNKFVNLCCSFNAVRFSFRPSGRGRRRKKSAAQVMMMKYRWEVTNGIYPQEGNENGSSKGPRPRRLDLLSWTGGLVCLPDDKEPFGHIHQQFNKNEQITLSDSFLFFHPGNNEIISYRLSLNTTTLLTGVIFSHRRCSRHLLAFIDTEEIEAVGSRVFTLFDGRDKSFTVSTYFQ